MQLWIDSFSFSLAIGLAVMVFLALGEFYGIRGPRNGNGRIPLVSLPFLLVRGSRPREFIYNLIMCEAPFISMLLVGMLFDDPTLISLVTSNLFVLVIAATMPVLMAYSQDNDEEILD